MTFCALRTSAPLTFADRLASRWRIGRLAVRPIDLTCVAARVLAFQSIVRRHVHAALTIVQQRLLVHVHAERLPAVRWSAVARERESAVAPRPTAMAFPMARTGNSDLVACIGARGQRVEVGGTFARAGSVERPRGDVEPASEHSRAVPVTLPLVRTSVVAVPAQATAADRSEGADRRDLVLESSRRVSAADGSVTPARSGARRHDALTPTASVWGPGDIERLADRVVSSIDRRIVAQRERLGRW